jgi:hypothetical protein
MRYNFLEAAVFGSAYALHHHDRFFAQFFLQGPLAQSWAGGIIDQRQDILLSFTKKLMIDSVDSPSLVCLYKFLHHLCFLENQQCGVPVIPTANRSVSVFHSHAREHARLASSNILLTIMSCQECDSRPRRYRKSAGFRLAAASLCFMALCQVSI